MFHICFKKEEKAFIEIPYDYPNINQRACIFSFSNYTYSADPQEAQKKA